MEDDLNGPLSDVEEFDHMKNGVASPIMAKFPDGSIAVINKEGSKQIAHPKINGDTTVDNKLVENDSCSSESDVLVIDENYSKKQNLKKRNNDKVNAVLDENCENIEIVTHSNPFFNESLFELSQLHQKYQKSDDQLKDCVDDTEKNPKNKKVKHKPKAKLHEYAQYLGLQPAIQFKCSKCARAGFETLTALQEHIVECDEQNIQEITNENSCSSLKLTRKVFLCSACGTYYENWNLYMHMLEIHQRYICLYCLGMFSVLEDLCQHLQSKHNLQPGYKSTPDDFFETYNEPCYLVCCECNKLFSEQDNFFYHSCNKNYLKGKKTVKTQITPENHVTGETEAIDDISSKLDKEIEEINKNCDESQTNKLKTQVENIAMETSNDHLTDINKSALQELMKVDRKTDNLSQKSCEEDETFLENNGHVEENVSSEILYTDDRMDVDTEETSCEKFQLKEYSDQEEMEDNSQTLSDEHFETRKVPKLSLKLPKPNMYADSAEDTDDSEKLTVDQIESENENEYGNNREQEVELNTPGIENHESDEFEGFDNENREVAEKSDNEEEQDTKSNQTPKDGNKSQMQVAGSDIQIVELVLEQPLDKFDPRELLQKCLKNTVQGCIYCNHARKIAVNGKQLALHCIGEHRFSAVVNSITEEELIPESFVNRLTECLEELETSFISLDSTFSNEAVTFSHLFECFQCYFSTTVHKELYLHNRKFHSKNLLLCIMCKSNFYSYSELICHLCPGLYVLDYDLQFRCCMCVNDDLPSSFRLMVHLRKKHNVCDVCLEMCHTQYRLSNHVWKHKLHHFCYRCGIAYRNKPDITRHLFWKHGTESVMCKKCLQKKWPHVYHFCVPPTNFTCDECGLNFIKAVSLKVHRRLHTDDKKHLCTLEGCQEKFISLKLKLRHERQHFEPPEEPNVEDNSELIDEKISEKVDEEKEVGSSKDDTPEERPKQIIDVLDLPALNLSESDSSDSESENVDQTINGMPTIEREKEEKNIEDENSLSINNADVETKSQNNVEIDLEKQNAAEENKENKDCVSVEPSEDMDSSNSVIQNIWNNFKNYQANKEKIDNMLTESERTEEQQSDEPNETEISPEVLSSETALRDHDYCLAPEQTTDSTIIEVKPALTESVDHDYCSPKFQTTTENPEPNVEQMETEEIHKEQEHREEENKSKGSSSSSSNSDSSSCSCGSNCSCSSSSGSSSSSSDSSGSDSSTEEGRKRQQLARKQRRKERAKKMKEQEKPVGNKIMDVVTPDAPLVPPPASVEAPIRESDLETTESETDEEFYDRAPQKLAKKILEEKRQQLLSIMGPNNVPNGSFIESTSRPPTPPAGLIVEEEERKKKKSKSKKRKKHRNERKEVAAEEDTIVAPLDIPIPPYYQQFHQTFNQPQQEPPSPISPITLSISRNSPVTTPSVPVTTISTHPKMQPETVESKHEVTDTTLRASKRRRVPNKFYGYSSDEEQEKLPVAKWRKTETPLPRSPLTVPPITIKTPQPPPPPPQVVEPISIRTGTHLSDFRVQRPRTRPPAIPPIRLLSRGRNDNDSATDSNESSSEEQGLLPPKPAQPQLYCYCRCPYDEVSEMIGCDASDCSIEWFHFECVGIMVPPKGQWFCPDCRKKKQQRRDFFQQQSRQHNLGSQQSI